MKETQFESWCQEYSVSMLLPRAGSQGRPTTSTREQGSLKAAQAPGIKHLPRTRLRQGWIISLWVGVRLWIEGAMVGQCRLSQGKDTEPHQQCCQEELSPRPPAASAQCGPCAQEDKPPGWGGEMHSGLRHINKEKYILHPNLILILT